MNKTVALLGNASRTRGYCPFDKLSVDIWPMGVHSFKAQRFTSMLEMHPNVMKGEKWDKAPDGAAYREWLRKNTNIPVYMHSAHPEIPASVQYPMEEIREKFLKHLWLGEIEIGSFFGGTASYALALAMHLGYQRIELYGIELSSRPDYDDERDCFFFWMGKATALGVDVIVHENSRLVREILYKGK